MVKRYLLILFLVLGLQAKIDIRIEDAIKNNQFDDLISVLNEGKSNMITVKDKERYLEISDSVLQNKSNFFKDRKFKFSDIVRMILGACFLYKGLEYINLGFQEYQHMEYIINSYNLPQHPLISGLGWLDIHMHLRSPSIFSGILGAISSVFGLSLLCNGMMKHGTKLDYKNALAINHLINSIKPGKEIIE